MTTTISSLIDLPYEVRYQIAVICLGVITWQQWTSYRRLAGFKGPFWAKFTNLWMANAVALRKQNLILYEVSQKYSELARIGPKILLTSDPDLLQRMSSARSAYTKSDWYAGQKLEVDHDNLFSTLDDKIHTKRRAQMAIGYSGKEILGLENTVDEHMLSWMALIRRKYISSDSELRPMDLARKAAFFTMDITTEISFGEPWGCLTKDEDVDKWFESSEQILPNAIMFSTIPWMASLFSIPIIGRLVMPSDRDPIGPGKLLGVIKEIVRKRFEPDDREQKRDMMGSFILHGITKTEAVSEATLQIVAGTDTTATTIRSTMLFIIRTVISDEEARTLPYLQSVIKEGARMWPPASGLLSKKTPPEGDTINGVFVPGGIDIGQCAWGVQRSKRVYGEDSMMFRPERCGGTRLEKMEKSLGLVWGYGKYSCLGKNIAWLELNKVFFELLRNFDITLIDPSRPWKSENVGLWMQTELFVRVTDRRGR